MGKDGDRIRLRFGFGWDFDVAWVRVMKGWCCYGFCLNCFYFIFFAFFFLGFGHGFA